MAVKFTKTDDLDKMFEEFAKLPDLEQVEFPDDKKKDPKKAQAK
ncbi:SPJ_0845 family protein [Streptococcus massiliensis]|uniref:Putative type II restriction endonuclease DpnI n=1 Tax=Streptococcus massiliensis TaxID=313439 RepID=A0A380KXE1_9STRE|nr:SPJ_0845 family protein [Streptococcus massiliensis]SUN76221.1 putative type II restriction endonuclease DpnI [Streptococcus massiliensis]